MTSPYCGVRTNSVKFCGLNRGHSGPHQQSIRDDRLPELTFTAAEVAELKAQCAAMLWEAAADAYIAVGMGIGAESVRDEILALIPSDHAAALAEVKRQARLEEAEWWSDPNRQYGPKSLYPSEQERLAALRTEGAKP